MQSLSIGRCYRSGPVRGTTATLEGGSRARFPRQDLPHRLPNPQLHPRPPPSSRSPSPPSPSTSRTWSGSTTRNCSPTSTRSWSSPTRGACSKAPLPPWPTTTQLLRERVEPRRPTAPRSTLLRIGMTLTAGEYVVARPARPLPGQSPTRHPTSPSARAAPSTAAGAPRRRRTIDCAFVEGLFDKSPLRLTPPSRTERLGTHLRGRPSPSPPYATHRWKTCLGERLILREEASGSRNVLVHALAQRNLSPASFADHFVVESLDIIKIFVQADLGISFVYEAAVQREVQEGTLRVIPPLRCGHLPRHQLHLPARQHLRAGYGRSFRSAQSIVFIPPHKKALRIVAKRLSAIPEFGDAPARRQASPSGVARVGGLVLQHDVVRAALDDGGGARPA